MKSLTSLALAVSLPVAALSAQVTETGVYPQDFALVDANTSDHLFPLQWNAPSRQMMVYDPDLFFMSNSLSTGIPVPDGAKITKIGFRKNAAHNSPGNSVKFQLWMGDAALPAQTASSTFQNNFS